MTTPPLSNLLLVASLALEGQVLALLREDGGWAPKSLRTLGSGTAT
jgi:hypothetical protein